MLYLGLEEGELRQGIGFWKYWKKIRLPSTCLIIYVLMAFARINIAASSRLDCIKEKFTASRGHILKFERGLPVTEFNKFTRFSDMFALWRESRRWRDGPRSCSCSSSHFIRASLIKRCVEKCAYSISTTTCWRRKSCYTSWRRNSLNLPYYENTRVN